MRTRPARTECQLATLEKLRAQTRVAKCDLRRQAAICRRMVLACWRERASIPFPQYGCTYPRVKETVAGLVSSGDIVAAVKELYPEAKS